MARVPVHLNTDTGLLAFLRDDFPDFVRARGKDYYRRGKVVLERVRDRRIEAVVQGTEPYHVVVSWEEGRLHEIGGACTCRSRAKFGPCKHVWAVLLDMQARGLGPTAEEVERAVLQREAHELEILEASEPDEEEPAEITPPFGPQEPPRGWRERIERAGLARPRAGRDPWPRVAGEMQLAYALDVEGSIVAGVPLLWIGERRRKKDGTWGSERPLARGRAAGGALRDPEDVSILAALGGAESAEPYLPFGFHEVLLPGEPAAEEPSGGYLLHATVARELLPRIAATGRLAWRSRKLGGGPLAWDEGETFGLSLALGPAAGGEPDELALTGELCRGSERHDLVEALVVFGVGFVVLPGRLARFDARGGMDWVIDLRRHGALRVPRDEEAELRALVLRTGGAAAAGLSLLPVEDAPPPVPHLLIVPRGKSAHLGVAAGRLEGRVSFDYGGTRIDPEHPEEHVPDPRGARLLRRARAAEEAALGRVLALGLRRTTGDERWRIHGTVAISRAAPLVRALLAEGWSVEAEGKRWRSAGGVSLKVATGVDWFDLRGQVDFGSGQSAALPELLAAAREGRHAVTLGDGSFGVLPERWMERWGLLGLAGKAAVAGPAESVRVPRAQGWLLDALLAARAEADSEVDAGFAEFRARLAQFQGVAPAHEPPGFHGVLRGYQRDGLGWLGFLRTLGLGGCLADDMGLGKTVQVLAHLLARRVERLRLGDELRPTLVVAPRSLVFNWLDEAARFTPELTTLDYTGPDRARLLAESRADVIVTTYGTVLRDVLDLKERRFDTLVLDEAQSIKNPASQSAKAARLLVADHRLALSGTPVENHLGELWSLFEFLNPGMLGRAGAFKTFIGGDARGRGANMGDLSRALRPFFLRRTKEEVLDDLPPKTEQIIACELEPAERKRYTELRDHYRAALLGGGAAGAELDAPKFQVLEALLRLRQCACHPGLLDRSKVGESSAKLEALLSRLEEVVEEGHKALVFSQFTSLLAIVRARLDGLGLTYEYLDGRTRDRKSKVERFQDDPTCPLFLVSLKAGGQGLNLTAADYVFLLDPWWNPAVESQAIDRAHRIGRTRPVFAYRLIAKDTVEERIQELQADKRALAEAVFAGGTGAEGALAALTREELERLLA